MRFYAIEPYNHRQKYALKKEFGLVDRPLTMEQQMVVNKAIGSAGIQLGSGSMADAFGKMASMAGKIVANPAVQNLGKATAEIGTTLAGHAIANKIAESGHPNLANAVQMATANPGQTLQSLLDEETRIRNMYKSGEITKADAITMLRKIMAMKQSGGVANLKHLAKRQYGKGSVMAVRTPRDVNNANGLQVGGFAPLAIAGLSAGLPLLASLVGPIVERLSGKYIASKI